MEQPLFFEAVSAITRFIEKIDRLEESDEDIKGKDVE